MPNNIPLKDRAQGSQNPYTVKTRKYIPTETERNRRANTDYRYSSDLSNQKGWFEAYVIKKGKRILNPPGWSLDTEGRQDTLLVVVRAYIVETNTIPSPDVQMKYADGSAPTNSNHFKNMMGSMQYDFIAVSPDLEIPDVGDQIWVDFGNSDFTAPRYHGIKGKGTQGEVATESPKQQQTDLKSTTSAPQGGSPTPTAMSSSPEESPENFVPDSTLVDVFIPNARDGYRVSKTARQINMVVIHTTQGGPNPVNAARNWFSIPGPQRNPPKSNGIHYLTSAEDTTIVQAVREQDVAFHAGVVNQNSIGIEMCANADKKETLTDMLYYNTARLTRDICDRYSIPIDREHIVGHVETYTTQSPQNHHDPGKYWDWDRFIEEVLNAQ